MQRQIKVTKTKKAAKTKNVPKTYKKEYRECIGQLYEARAKIASLNDQNVKLCSQVFEEKIKVLKAESAADKATWALEDHKESNKTGSGKSSHIPYAISLIHAANDPMAQGFTKPFRVSNADWNARCLN